MFFVRLVTHPKSYIETTDRCNFGGKPLKWRWGRVLSWKLWNFVAWAEPDPQNSIFAFWGSLLYLYSSSPWWGLYMPLFSVQCAFWLLPEGLLTTKVSCISPRGQSPSLSSTLWRQYPCECCYFKNIWFCAKAARHWNYQNKHKLMKVHSVKTQIRATVLYTSSAWITNNAKIMKALYHEHTVH